MKATAIQVRHPQDYGTLAGLMRATERVLVAHRNTAKITGCSTAMWLQNAEFIAQSRFGDASSIQSLRQKHATTRAQDLVGGHSVFGCALPTRSYIVGDSIPGVGRIDDLVEHATGKQFCIGGQWYSERCFESP